MKLYRKLVLALGAIAVTAVAGTTIVFANPGTAITTTILGHRATLTESVQVNQDRVKFQTKDPTDVLVQTITFQPQATSGWHFHPGVVIVVVESGQVTTHNASCQTVTYGQHESFVESGTDPFMVSNESATDKAVVYATLVVPAGSVLRIETDPPACA
jgi:quercetin dioxygenase-like cupin family protein